MATKKEIMDYFEKNKASFTKGSTDPATFQKILNSIEKSKRGGLEKTNYKEFRFNDPKLQAAFELTQKKNKARELMAKYRCLYDAAEKTWLDLSVEEALASAREAEVWLARGGIDD